MKILDVVVIVTLRADDVDEGSTRRLQHLQGSLNVIHYDQRPHYFRDLLARQLRRALMKSRALWRASINGWCSGFSFFRRE